MKAWGIVRIKKFITGVLALSLLAAFAFTGQAYADENTNYVDPASQETAEAVTGDAAADDAVNSDTEQDDTNVADSPSDITEAEETLETEDDVAAQNSVEPANAIEDETPLSLTAQGHVASIGWQNSISSGAGKVISIGTTGKAKSLEAVKLQLSVGSIMYRSHISDYGWESDWVSDNELSGTTGKSKAIEAVQIKLSDDLAYTYDIYYRAHVADLGWLGWAKNGECAGTEGLSKGLEQLDIVVLPKGQTPEGYDSSVAAFKKAQISWKAHIQSYGNRSGRTTSLSDTISIGTTGEAKRLEAFALSVPGVDGGVSYQAFCQDYGWMAVKSDGQLAGTTGESRRLEALKINLTGEAANAYDIYYRVHVANIGWLGWAKNGETAGTKDGHIQVEMIQIKLVEKGAQAPGSTAVKFLDNSSLDLSLSCMSGTDGSTSYASVGMNEIAGSTGKAKALTGVALRVSGGQISGGISYAAHVTNIGWLSVVSDGSQSQSGSNAVQAIKISLTGNLADYYDVYYRAHVAGYGWEGWTKNGAYAGTTGLSKNLEAYQVKIVLKGSPAPGSTANSFSDADGFLGGPSSDSELNRIIRNIINNKTGRGSDALRKAYEYVCGYKYVSGSLWPSGSWQSWSIPYAKEMYNNDKGNCYRYASLLTWIARGLGYDAKPIAGSLKTKSGYAAHSWVEITVNGTAYICDPAVRTSNIYVFMTTYENAPLYYVK